MKPKARRFTVVAGSSQFYVADALASDDTGSDDFWTLQAMDDRLATAPGTLSLGTGPDAGVVTVVVENRDTAPTKGGKTWDHVTEASLGLVNGRLVVRG